jgi:hypothetical protein
VGVPAETLRLEVKVRGRAKRFGGSGGFQPGVSFKTAIGACAIQKREAFASRSFLS